MARTLRYIFDNAIQLLNIEKGDNSPVFIRERVVADINAAMQTMQMGEKDYFAREEVTIALGDEVSAYDLPEEVLNVVLPARLADGTVLRDISSRGEYDLFGQIFLG